MHCWLPIASYNGYLIAFMLVEALVDWNGSDMIDTPCWPAPRSERGFCGFLFGGRDRRLYLAEDRRGLATYVTTKGGGME